MKTTSRRPVLNGQGRQPKQDLIAVVDLLRRSVYFEHVVVAGVDQGARAPGTGSIIHCDWPAEVLERYLAERMFLKDPCVRALKERRSLVQPADVLRVAGDDREMHGTISYLRESGIPLPTILPVFHLQNLVGSISFSRNKPFSGDEIFLLQIVVPPLHRLFAEDIRSELSEGVQLTLREVECLRHASKGLTSEEIAEVMPLAAATITAQLRSAAGKLGAANRTSAIAEAIRRGIIE